MNIFQLSAKYQYLMEKIENTDEITVEMIEEIENTNDNLEEKILNYTSIVKTMESKAKGIDEAINAMAKRSESIKNGIEYLKGVIKSQMEKCDKKKIENEYHAVSLIINNPRVNYLDKSLIPPAYMRRQIKEIVEPNGNLILKCLKENVAIPGATLARDYRLAIK